MSTNDCLVPNAKSCEMGSCFSLSDRISPTSEKREEVKKRTTTDVFFLIFLSIFLTILLVFVGYCVFKGNIYRIINGYDSCGVVCSNKMTHKQFTDDFCSNLPNGPYLIAIADKNNVSTTERFCISNCSEYSGYQSFFNRCIKTNANEINLLHVSKTGLRNFFIEVVEDLHFVWPQLCILCLISLVFSVLILLLFRYFAGIVVWLVLIGTVVVAVAGTAALWYMHAQSKTMSNDFMTSEEKHKNSDVYFWFAIISTIVTILLIVIIFAMRKRIKLVVQLFAEAGKAITAMPLLLPQPILTFISLSFITSLWILFCLFIESAGTKTLQPPHHYHYEKDNIIRFTRWYNLFAMFWMVQFTIGCQHMVISGAVSNWYFTRAKNQLDSPICKSVHNLLRYHLGSVAMGSFIIAVVQFVRIIFKMVQKTLAKEGQNSIFLRVIAKCCNACLFCFEEVIKFLSRNAYIEVAMNGHSFCYGGKQAFKMIASNALRVSAINSIGDFVLFLGKVLVVIGTVLVGLKLFQNTPGVHHMWVPIALCGLFAYFIANCFLDVYEMAIDTIFLCFCHDCEENDGLSRPYYMSSDLMDFLENSKKALEAQREKKRSSHAWTRKSADIATISGDLDKNKV